MKHIYEFQLTGFVIVVEIEKILIPINYANTDKETFRKSSDLFAIWQFLKEIPSLADIIFNENLNTILKQLPGNKYFVVKSIYFDNPTMSNCKVSYHQDLTISVDKRIELKDF